MKQRTDARDDADAEACAGACMLSPAADMRSRGEERHEMQQRDDGDAGIIEKLFAESTEPTERRRRLPRLLILPSPI